MQKSFPLVFVLPALYGVGVFLFFWKIFPYHLHFQEQFQLFLFTKNYFLETCSHPGGFCNYAGRFLTQFYISSFAGALILGCLLTGVQQLIYAIAQRFRKHSMNVFFSFLPSLFYWYLFCDEDYQLGGLIALNMTLITIWAGTFFKSRSAFTVYLFACIPVLYWLAGGTAIISAILLIGYKWRSQPVFLSIGAICLALSLPFIAKYFLKFYLFSRFFWGVDYGHFVSFAPVKILYLWILILLVITAVSFLPDFKPRKLKGKVINENKRKTIFASVQIVSLLMIIYFAIFKIGYSQNLWKEEIMMYDYHCKMQNWEKVIENANKKPPALPLSVSCLNLALYKTGQLPDKMFHYFQNGPEGLLPTFQRDFMIPMIAGEAYWHLGFVNTAQRFVFEAQESFPDYQKSVRTIKRMAETNLVNGYYEATSKYLFLLENTLFYRKWAKETRAFLYNEEKIITHPEWGKIKSFQVERDFLFSGREKDKMLGIFFQHNRDNRMAYEYLLAYTLLSKDVRNFPVYFQFRKNFTYREIPKSYQEALVYIWGLSNNDFDSMPFTISASVKQQVLSYAQIYTSMENPEPVLKKQFSKSYWYYLHFRDYNQTSVESQLQY